MSSSKRSRRRNRRGEVIHNTNRLPIFEPLESRLLLSAAGIEATLSFDAASQTLQNLQMRKAASHVFR